MVTIKMDFYQKEPSLKYKYSHFINLHPFKTDMFKYKMSRYSR